MKKFKSILLLTTSLLFNLSCGDKTTQTYSPKTSSDNKSYSSYEINISSRDTINIIDADGKKQGEWLLYRRVRKGNALVPIEAGNYLDNKKQGFWKYYDSSGKLIQTIKFKNDQSLN
jgi:hypothetical protein